MNQRCALFLFSCTEKARRGHAWAMGLPRKEQWIAVHAHRGKYVTWKSLAHHTALLLRNVTSVAA